MCESVERSSAWVAAYAIQRGVGIVHGHIPVGLFTLSWLPTSTGTGRQTAIWQPLLVLDWRTS
jgi:hypothetical protein